MPRPLAAGSRHQKRWLITVKAIPALIVVLMIHNGCGSGAKTNSQTQQTGNVLSVSASSLTFGTVTVGSTSEPQNIVLTATDGSIMISSLNVQQPFTASTVPLPTTLETGKSLTVQVSFSPASQGAVTLASGLTFSSNAENSPTAVSLSGTGSVASTSSGCAGTGIPQTPANVTTKLTSVAPGITVTQVTNAGVVGGSWNTYADIPAYSAPANSLIYNYGTNPAGVASANLDGTGAQLISGNQQATETYVTGDGKFAYYQGQNTDGSADIYAVPISQSGPCQQNRLSQRNMSFIAPAMALIISTSTFNSQSGHNVIAFSEGTELHEVLDDGTALPDLILGDPENNDVFHRMRLNPVFPNILWYKRDLPPPNPDGTAQPEIWIVNLQSPGTVYSVTGSIPSDHASWSKDGTKLGYIYNGFWYQADVLNSDGSFNLNSSGGFTLTEIGPAQNSGFTVNYCNLSPDGSVYVCSESYQAIYLMSLDGTQTKFLASPDSSSTGAIFNGIPKPVFLDMQHIVFSSDRTGTPQVYVITGFTTTFP